MKSDPSVTHNRQISLNKLCRQIKIPLVLLLWHSNPSFDQSNKLNMCLWLYTQSPYMYINRFIFRCLCQLTQLLPYHALFIISRESLSRSADWITLYKTKTNLTLSCKTIYQRKIVQFDCGLFSCMASKQDANNKRIVAINCVYFICLHIPDERGSERIQTRARGQ